MATDDSHFEVQLYVYDISRGMAKQLSPLFLGKQIHGIWHTAVIAYGREYFFGGMGIESCEPGQTIMGEPDQMIPLGRTELPYQLFLEYIFELGESSYKPESYDLFKHNCNNFSNDLAQFLTGKGVPKEILELPVEILNTPIGASLQQFFHHTSLKSDSSRGLSFGQTAVNQLANVTPEQLAQQGRARSPTPTLDDIPIPPSTQRPPPESRDPSQAMSAGGDEGNTERSSVSPEADGEGPLPRPDFTPRKTRRYEDPAICFKDVDGVAAFMQLDEKIKGNLGEADKAALHEINEYLMTDVGAWSLGQQQIDLLANLLGEQQDPAVRLLTVKVLQAAVLKDDFILFLHQDRKSHVVMSYLFRIEKLPLDEQEAIIVLLCNLCEQPSTFDWLMYISEWPETDGQACNNSKVTIRAVVHGLLCENVSIAEKSAALMYNLALKELFDDIATELATAVLQYLHSDLSEEAAFLALTAVYRFVQLSYNDVAALVTMLGPDLSKFNGKSARVDQVLKDLKEKMAAGPRVG